MTPSDARNPENYQHVHNALYAKVNARKATSHKFLVDDKLRVTRKKGTFEKGFTPNWTEEVFTIISVKLLNHQRKPSRKRLENQFMGPFMRKAVIECTGNFSYRTVTQEVEKSSICQVERLQ